jgi:hypothetical protein
MFSPEKFLRAALPEQPAGPILPEVRKSSTVIICATFNIL